MRFDEAKRTFDVNVRELAEEEGFRRVGFDRGEGWRRLGLGTQIHSQVLAARRETFGAYRCEVHLQARIPIEEWTAVLTGRLDGCIEREAGHWLIEEFKSTDLPSEGIRPAGYAFERLLTVRAAVTKALEEVRQSGLVKQSLEARIVLDPPDDLREFLSTRAPELPTLFLAGEVELGGGLVTPESPIVPGLRVAVERARGGKCQRCWNVRALGGDPRHPALCSRCAAVVTE